MSVRDVHGGAWNGAAEVRVFKGSRDAVSNVQADVEDAAHRAGGELCGADRVVGWAQYGDLFVRSFAEDLQLCTVSAIKVTTVTLFRPMGQAELDLIQN